MYLGRSSQGAVCAATTGPELSQSGLGTTRKSRPNGAGRRRKVFLVDRHALMRLATVGWVKRCSSLEVCGMAGSMPHALKAVRRLRPDVIVSEIFRPRDLGFIRELHRRHPRLPIIVFSLLDEEAYAPEALAAGACGYLMKGVKGDTLVDAICDALKGRVVFSPAMARRLCRNRESQWAKISILPRPLGL